jgi:hypothetical protein
VGSRWRPPPAEVSVAGGDVLDKSALGGRVDAPKLPQGSGRQLDLPGRLLTAHAPDSISAFAWSRE